MNPYDAAVVFACSGNNGEQSKIVSAPWLSISPLLGVSFVVHADGVGALLDINIHFRGDELLHYPVDTPARIW